MALKAYYNKKVTGTTNLLLTTKPNNQPTTKERIVYHESVHELFLSLLSCWSNYDGGYIRDTERHIIIS